MPATLPIQETEDDTLVAAVCAGEVQKYRLLFDRHAEALQVHVAFRVWVPHLVSEMVHDTFLWAYRHLDEFQAGTSFQAWLRAIAWNRIRAEVQRFARENQRRGKLSDASLWLNRITDQETDEVPPRVEALRECLERLRKDPRAHQLIHLRYHEGLNSTQIAPLVSQSPVWVRVTLHRAIHHLRNCVIGKSAAPQC
jgi:RNA polymerase sigma-70 factor (ECF subfamily)